MKTQNLLLVGALCLGLSFMACQKDDAKEALTDLVAVRAISCGDVVVTAPTQVCIDEEFTISVVSSPSCGRVKLQQESTSSVCDAAETAWTDLVGYTCHNVGFPSATLSFSTPGIYTFRSMHNAMAPTPCGAGRVTCGFSGNNFCCFSVEVVECGCETSFTGEAQSCDATREATYTFVSEDAQDYVKIQGGLTNFVDGDDAVVTVTGGDGVEITQVTQGGSSNRRITVEFAADACEEVTIHITWNSTNGGGIITGDWSAVDEDGVDLAPEVSGLDCD